MGKATSAFINTKEKLPMKFVGGFSKKLAHLPLLLNVNVYKYIRLLQRLYRWSTI